ncbi:adenylosuccinate lyase [Patescibacteria group bacterium]|nr:adenylosuccinate lyase [Patescibacteria group bacterium]
MSKLDFTNYLSPFTWRYGSDEMRQIFSEENKYKIWRKIWVALARAQNKAGLVSKEELDDLENQQGNIDIQAILENEKETKHDVVAAIHEFARKAKIGGGKIHLGATSMDIVDNTDAIRIKDGLEIIEQKAIALLSLFSQKIEQYKDLTCIGYTHLQPAEPTTVGYRLSVYAQDLLTDYRFLKFIKSQIKGKGMKGAVGTQAGYASALEGKNITPEILEKDVMQELGIEAVLISTQVYPRKFDFFALSVLNSIASTLSKFAADLRILQSPSIGEWSEPFGENQVGSSAMPFKKNPINSEKICSLARFVSSFPDVALENASLSYLERTLDDSANKRIIIPEAFLAVDEILRTSEKLVNGLIINEKKITFNLSQYAPFAATEAILVEAVKNGANRQEMHEILKNISLIAWKEVQEGKINPMSGLLTGNEDIKKYVSEEKIRVFLNVDQHVGTAPERARQLVSEIKKLTH